MEFESKCLYEGYEPQNGEPRVLPICQSTTFKYSTTEQVGNLFDLTDSGFFYTRLANPTVDAVEKKISALEGGVGALMTSSGQSANFIALINILGSGDHFISLRTIYGGTYNLFGVTMKKLGIDVTFVDGDISDDELQKLFKPNTKAVFGETLTNPTMEVFDIERFAEAAHKNNVPLIVDNTFATPYLCRPFEFGADIVTHSTTKYMDGQAVQMGGVVVDGGKFDWTKGGKFSEYTEPDDSYHGMIYTKQCGNAAYITKARVQMMRDLGVCQTPQGAFYVNLGLETLSLRMDKHCQNALEIAKYLKSLPQVESVNYPSLDSDKYNFLAKKYLPKGSSGVIAFTVKGGRDTAAKFMDNLKMISILVHVADIRSCVLHPASGTHRQLSDEALIAAGISAGLIRFSVGCENIKDIISDINQAFGI